LKENKTMEKRNINLLIIVSALGYFVDVYDLLLFGVVKSASLTGIGVKTDQLVTGIVLTNYQVLGLVMGGLIWGILGDKRGRLSVLFGSIFIYSAANVANYWVDSLTMYKACRFMAGVGLAGELGAGIALVMETVNRKKNYGPQIITGFGLLGAVVAGILGEKLNWRVTYLVGGLMGFVLLLLRFGVRESYIFMQQHQHVVKGRLLDLINKPARLKTYLLSILIGLPVYFVIALLIQSAKELGAQSHLNVTSATATIVCYVTFAASDFFFTWLSNRLQSRRKVFIGLHLASVLMLLLFIYLPSPNAFVFYTKYALFGVAIGYWGLLTVNAAEQFPTKIRALACTTVPNFIRGSFYFIGLAFTALKGPLGLNTTITIVGLCLILIALGASLAMKDGYHHQLDLMED